jgi:hypothetical protein
MENGKWKMENGKWKMVLSHRALSFSISEVLAPGSNANWQLAPPPETETLL